VIPDDLGAWFAMSSALSVTSMSPFYLRATLGFTVYIGSLGVRRTPPSHATTARTMFPAFPINTLANDKRPVETVSRTAHALRREGRLLMGDTLSVGSRKPTEGEPNTPSEGATGRRYSERLKQPSRISGCPA
jgi:hypothetical protein